ncbi:MAG: SDR family NAD(P)-dependent oxidoreductase [Saprospiraceae bacterium]
MKHFVLVTGASSGIGEAICQLLVQNDYEVLAGVRRIEDAERLSRQYGSKVHPLILDVTDHEAVKAALSASISTIGENMLVAIVNNAGIVVSGSSLHIPIEEWQKQFDINVMGVIRVTQLFFPLLISGNEQVNHHPRRIINMSSVSGLFGSPFLGPYVASKYALEGYSDSLRRELYMHDVQVVLIEPGGIKTPIWEKARGASQYLGPEHEWMIPLKDKLIERTIAKSLPVEKVVVKVLHAIRSRNVKNRYLIKAEAWKFRLIRSLPEEWVDRMIMNRLKAKSRIRPF